MMVDKIKRVFKIKDIEKDTNLLDDEINIIDTDFNKNNTLKQLTYIFEHLNIESNISNDEAQFYVISNNGEVGLTRTVKEYKMNLNTALDFLITEYNLEYCPNCGMYEKEIFTCEHCNSKVCKENCAILNTSDSLIGFTGAKADELKKYNVVCNDCYNSITNYNNDDFYNLIRIESDEISQNLISNLMKECNLYVTEPKKSFYSLYFDDNFSQELIYNEKRYGYIIKEIVEYYVKNKINPVLEANKNPMLRDKILSLKEPLIDWENKLAIEDKELDKKAKDNDSKNNKVDKDTYINKDLSNISLVNDSNLLGKKFKKEDLIYLLSLLTTEELLIEIKSRIIR